MFSRRAAFRQNRGRIGAGAPWNPTLLPGCVLWLRADLGITLNGSTVSAWADQSGNGNNLTQATASAQPPFVGSYINGLPSLQFNGAQSLGASVAVLGASTWTVFVVALLTAGPAFSWGTVTNGWGLQNHSGTRDIVAYGVVDQNDGATSGSVEIWAAQNSGGVTTLQVNGATNTLTPNNAVQNIVGAGTQVGAGNGSFFVGYVPEVIAYAAALTASQIQQVNGYLGSRYGIAV